MSYAWLIIIGAALAGCTSSGTDSIGVSQNVTEALTSGDAQLITEPQELITAIDVISEDYNVNQLSVLEQVYGNGAVDYPVSRHSQFIQVKELARAYPLVIGNGGLLLAAASDMDGQRNAAFGSNVISELANGRFSNYEAPFKNVLSWLMNRSQSDITAQANVALLTVSSGTASNSEKWINQHFNKWQVDNCNDGATLSSCIADADLVIISTTQNIEQGQLLSALASLKAQNIPVLYVHQDSWNTSGFTSDVLNTMGFYMQSNGGPGNYFSQDQALWDSYHAMQSGTNDVADIYQMVRQLQQDSFSFDIAACEDNCDAIDAYNKEYKNPLATIRNLINQLDKDKVKLFSTQGYELEKLLVLLADKYRQEIVYPMDTKSTSTGDFLKAMFADSVIYNYRTINPAQADLGNFSRTDFSHITPTNKTVTLNSKRHFRSAGVYALPGVSFQVKRLDSSDLTTKIFINTQRSGSTHEFANNGYSRPKYLQSQHIEVKSGETVTLTNPYGGPVQIEFSSNDLPVQFEFMNVGLHPYWNGPEDDISFSEALAAEEYDWAELITPGFEVHSQLSKMRQSMSNENFTSAKALSDATMRYVHNFPHVLAGFQGPNIDVVSEIHDFAQDHDYTIDTIDMVKHMNADQATCGSGCSGNPYDAYWSFNPVGHGDIHELGHGLERGRFRFAGWDGHASTNPYSYYTKTQFFKDTGSEPSCQSLPFDNLLQALENSQQTANPFVYMQEQSLTSWNQGVAIYIQMMMAAQNQGALQDGWHLLARLHIYEREFNRAVKNEDAWAAKRNSLGLGSYTLTDAKALSNNDWLAQGISWVTELDYRAFLTMWGLSFSSEISDQIQQHNFTQTVAQFYQASGNDYCYGLDKTPLSVTQ